MSDNEGYRPESSFTALVITLSSSAWVGLGKVEDPVSGGIRKDLQAVKATIDILLMLRDKTRGNLGPEENKLLDGVIADLQANYAETVFDDRGKKDADNGSQQQTGPEEKGE
ncbi:MAG: DUF1844 domain-containing protein [Spirochaetes bacterium]|nr:DUF1844 domain-containing protein [Spirochaetota bacterium]